MPRRTRTTGRRRAASLATLLLLTAVTACSGSSTTDTTGAGTAPTSVAPADADAGRTSGTTTAPAATSGTAPSSIVPTGSAPSVASVASITIEIDDPGSGHLVFDALAAGDPAAAKDGRLVLLLHGFPETSDAWQEQLQPLADAGYYAVAPNQRGYSPRARPVGVDRYRVESLVDDVFAMADALGAESFHLVGHDWGAAVSWAAAAAEPARVRSLMVLSVPHPDAFADAFANADGEQTRKSRYMDVFRQPGSEDRFVENDAAGLRIIWGDEIPDAKIDAYLRVLGTPEALGAALNWYRATEFATSDRVGPVTVATTFVWGTDDIAIARSGAEATKDFVEGPYRFEALEGISHWIPEEVPDVVRTLLLAHLASAP